MLKVLSIFMNLVILLESTKFSNNILTLPADLITRVLEVSPSISLDILLSENETQNYSSFHSTYTQAFVRVFPRGVLRTSRFLRHPSILFLLPKSLQEHREMSLKLSELTKAMEGTGIWKIWNPVIYIRWPTLVSQEPKLTSDDVIVGNFSMNWQITFLFQTESRRWTVWNYQRINHQSVWTKLDPDVYQPLIKAPFGLYQLPIQATALNDSENASMVSFRRTSTGQLEFDRGCSVSVLNDLKDILNFTINAMEGSSYISQFPNGSMRGIGRQLVDGEADVAVPLSYVLPYRQAALTALHPLSVDKFLVFFRQPPASTVRYVFTQPFNSALWLCLVLIWLLFELSILTFNQVQTKARTMSKHKMTASVWNSSLLLLIALISQQGWHENPSEFSGKVLLMTGMFNGLVPFMAYSASIVSVLSATVVPVKNFHELLNTQFVLIADPLIGFGQYLTPSQGSSLADSEQMLASNLYVSGENAVKRVLRGGHAFINTHDVFSPIARSLNYSDKDICDQVSWVVLPSVSLAMSFFVPKASPFKEILNIKLIYIMERGLNHRYIKTLNTETRVACEQRSNKSKQEELSLRDLFAAFIIISLGCLASLLLLKIEKMHHNWRKQLEFKKGFIH